jgi:hypothetical protein
MRLGTVVLVVVLRDRETGPSTFDTICCRRTVSRSRRARLAAANECSATGTANKAMGPGVASAGQIEAGGG